MDETQKSIKSKNRSTCENTEAKGEITLIMTGLLQGEN